MGELEQLLSYVCECYFDMFDWFGLEQTPNNKMGTSISKIEALKCFKTAVPIQTAVPIHPS